MQNNIIPALIYKLYGIYDMYDIRAVLWHTWYTTSEWHHNDLAPGNCIWTVTTWENCYTYSGDVHTALILQKRNILYPIICKWVSVGRGGVCG